MTLTNHLAQSYGPTLATASREVLIDILVSAGIELHGRHPASNLSWNHPILEAMVEAPDDEILAAIALVTERLRFNPHQKQQP